MKSLFTSESVTEGHPDKLADQISDSLLDAFLAQDPGARVAAETLVTTGLVFVGGEISTECYVDVASLVRRTVLDVGYTSSQCGFDGATCAILTPIDEQSGDIASGVNRAFEARSGEGEEELGAGDQGMVFGYACDETPELMPMPIASAHALSRRLADVRKDGTLPYLRPDGKTQVTIEYVDDRPRRVDTILVSAQHAPEVSMDELFEGVKAHVIRPVIPEELMDNRTRIFVNPSGRFVLGGPQADTGLTGRKIIVDTYGGFARHGGGAFSGKDPTKVDRSGCYAARWAAKNVVAAGLARHCELQIAYAIGMARPISLRVETFGTGALPDDVLADVVSQVFDFRPAKIIDVLGLRRPIYRQVASYGHFGRPDLDLPWERTDRVTQIKEAARALAGV